MTQDTATGMRMVRKKIQLVFNRATHRTEH